MTNEIISININKPRSRNGLWIGAKYLTVNPFQNIESITATSRKKLSKLTNYYIAVQIARARYRLTMNLLNKMNELLSMGADNNA